MKRHLINALRHWRKQKDRKPLILMGVRQTGKTYLLENFGRKDFTNYHVINFEKQTQAKTIFEADLEPDRILTDLQFFLKKPIDIKQDLVIFDEIQACPRALTSLKYFCENKSELALCSAGSLLGLHLNEGSYPVGKVDMLQLHPMTFSEFLMGINDRQASEYFDNLSLTATISETAHQHLWARLKHYFIVGGLPEAVSIFATHQNDLYHASKAVRQKQTELIKGYYADIAKHAGKVNAMHIDRTWQAVSTQLAQTQDASSKRFRFKDIIPNINRYAQLIHVIDWLNATELVIKIPLIEKIREPLQAFTKESMFKLFMFDVGILAAMSNLAPETILQYDYGTYKGYFAENFVAQQLIATHREPLLSWQKDRSEVEFLLQNAGNVFPVEVKSGNITHAKSLQKYVDLYHPKKSFVLSANNLKVDERQQKYHLPLYLAEKI